MRFWAVRAAPVNGWAGASARFALAEGPGLMPALIGDCAPAAPATATRAKVSSAVFMGGLSCVVGTPATRGAERTFRAPHFLLCPLFAMGVACGHKTWT